MKKALTMICAGMLIGMPFVVSAADDKVGYIGVNYLHLEQYNLYDFVGDDRIDTGDFAVRIGGYLNEYFSSELRLGATINPYKEQSNVVWPAAEAEYKRNYLVSAFLRAGYPLGFVTPYVAVGYSGGKERLEHPAGKDSDTFEDISYGAGVDVHLGESLGLNLEYTQYYDIGDQRLQGPSLGLLWRFE